MSPEEFDNRLRSSFNDEFVPPKEHLWHNINTRLDQKAKKPVWYWLSPVAIVAIASIAWLSYALISNDTNNIPEVNTLASTSNSTSAQSANPVADASASQANKITATDNSQTTDAGALENPLNLNNNSNQGSKASNPFASNNNGKNRTGNTRPTKGHKSLNAAGQYNESPFIKQSAQNNGASNNDASNSNTSATDNLDQTDNSLSQSVFSRLFFIKRFKRNFSIDLLSKAERTPTKWPEIKQPGKGQHSAEDMAWGGNFEDNKWWLNFGFGNQVAFNSFHGTYDSATKNKIHKKLIENEEQLTHNGSGSQIHLNIQNKFGKGNRFSFETGINYSFRTEDIKMNEQTYDIAARNNNDDILNYLRLKLFIAVGTDTTFFDATQSFALVTKNKYSIITVPLRFQYEQPLNRNTFISLGLGGGASIVKNNSTTHYDMVKEKEFQSNKSKYLTASLNTMLSIYTNYNGIGQFGIYGGYQMYLTPFKVNEQYGVRMSDLQFGFILRRPLDLK